MARKYGDVKFCEIKADMCIEAYPDRNTPTILVYKNNEIRRQIITLAELNGPRTSIVDLEKLLLDLGAVQENDVRIRRKRSEDDLQYLDRERPTTKEDDDEWD